MCRLCNGTGLIESGDGFHEPVLVEYCECEAGLEAEQRDAVSFAVLEALGVEVIEPKGAFAA